MKGHRVAAFAIGCALDAALGDPHGWPHVVRLVGKQVEFEESLLRRYVLDDPELADGIGNLSRSRLARLCGAALAADVALLSPLAFRGALELARRVHPAAGIALEGVAFYQLIAARSLRDESMAVYDALADGDVEAAREAVSQIVGRDTEALDEAGIARAAVETVAENASDGVVAPMLYMAAGGAPAAMLYKAVNTLDSMVGYKNERYRDLGWASARLDDALNLVPSRVTGALMCVSARLAGLDAGRAWRTFLRDRNNHPSPNAGQPESACAGALGVQLGGSSAYGGRQVAKPVIGEATREVSPDDIVRANDLMSATAALAAGLIGACALAVGLAKRRRV